MVTNRAAVELLIIALVVFTAAVIHAVRVRGWFVAVRFFLFASLFFFIKGLVDLPRTPDEMPWVMNIELFKHGRFFYGAAHLLVVPLRCGRRWPTRASASVHARSCGGGGAATCGSSGLNGLSVIVYCTLGTGIEMINYFTHWWTWNEHMGVSVFAWFLLWLVWGRRLLPLAAAELPRRAALPSGCGARGSATWAATGSSSSSCRRSRRSCEIRCSSSWPRPRCCARSSPKARA